MTLSYKIQPFVTFCHSDRSEPTPFLRVRSYERVGSRSGGTLAQNAALSTITVTKLTTPAHD